MSGGSHDYAYSRLEDIAASFWVEREPIEQEEARKKVADILRHMAKICHDIEWIDSCDYGKEDWAKVLEMLGKITLEREG